MFWCSVVLGFVASVLGKMPVKGFVIINIVIVITITVIVDIIDINIHGASI